MIEKISQIVDIIGDYRKDDIGKLVDNNIYNIKVDNDHVLKWVSQFKESDQEFIIDEFLHLIKKSYLSEQNLIKILDNAFEFISEKFGFENTKEFLLVSRFIDNQQPDKSQKIFLNIIENILNNKYQMSISDCGNKIVKYFLYFDDVLATGGNFSKDTIYTVAEYGQDDFINYKINVIGVFIAIHTFAKSNVPFSMNFTIDGIKDRIKFISVLEIENNPRINHYNPNPKFNHVYPLKSELGNKVLEYIENVFFSNSTSRNEQFAFRNIQFPQVENYFSSKENRIRYENIILEKSFEIMQSISNITIPGLRPLGVTNPSNKTLGTGTHFFTWRNISNTCPIVFWWGQGWYPLFPVKGRGK